MISNWTAGGLSHVRAHWRRCYNRPSPGLRVSVALISEARGILVLVAEYGPGEDPPPTEESARANHLSAASVAERAELFGGTLDVMSTPGDGTTVRLPIDA